MNSIFIVLPILTLLMFDLGLTLRISDFALIVRSPKAMLMGLVGQLVLLPLVAWGVVAAFDVPAMFVVGVMLIACCPGGSSSNVFSMLARGDVALSVSLTAVSSVVTLFTLPLVMQWVTAQVGDAVGIHLPVGNLLMQNLATMFVPIALGIVVRWRWSRAASAIERVLSRFAFPALLLLATIFFVQHQDTIAEHFTTLGACVTALLLVSVIMAGLLSRVAKLDEAQRRTIVIEVGMQNAAQAIAVASSPFVFNDGRIAIPAIIYALMMNVVLLGYVAMIKVRGKFSA